MRERISWSDFTWPGGSSAFHFHCSHRAELVNVPSFSANPVAGRRYTSVRICEGGAPPYSFGASQNFAVSISTFSTTSIHLSLDMAAIIFLELGPRATGFMPKVMKPSGPGSFPPARIELPLYMSSNRYIQE